ncbi:alpha/beta hydrolase [Fulvivirga kasyanovii]|uniref:Alpha/beta hydrolase n=1 Tax=Fulvivirga kasyanovii TaxID=396812 RepID=A0ABW9RWI0_9BACT|nr:alpha/beta hydrolase [Fulvivirga kasyanovii]MTI27634.1 alpha/beta hydrolase [Fulvivirga kasyanovii]
MKISILAAICLLGSVHFVHGQTNTESADVLNIPLSSRVVGADINTWEGGERTQVSNWDQLSIVSNVSQPSLIAYLPERSKSSGTALIIAPGGGFHLLSIDNEGHNVAKWCVENGIAAFVLKYRLVPTGEDPDREFHEKLNNGQEEMDRDMAPYIDLAKADALAAIAHVRANAEKYNVDTDKIGIIGFSAGGTLAASAGLEFTSDENRPDFIAPIYGALHVLDLAKLPTRPMPLFLAVTSDDVFGFQNQAIDIYKTWNKAKAPVEMHIYQKGGHGFGMRKQNLPSDLWVENFCAWMKDNGF